MKSSCVLVSRQLKSPFSKPVTLQADDIFSLRMYWDSRPHYLEIAPLQKGLVLLANNQELIEEGSGFGVPVVKYLNHTYFSSSAESWIEQVNNHFAIVKLFVLDSIARKRIGNAAYINDNVYRFFHKLFEKAYLGHKKWAFIFNYIMQLRRTVGVQTDFVKVKAKGKVMVKYTFEPGLIHIHVDLAELDREEIQEVLILNEQGSTFFRKYSDTTGLKLLDENIGAWEKVLAREAAISNAQETLKFTLLKQKGNSLFRGWEKTGGRFAWTGLGYSINPNLSEFEYTIHINNLAEKKKTRFRTMM
jgi:hypothetical protein